MNMETNQGSGEYHSAIAGARTFLSPEVCERQPAPAGSQTTSLIERSCGQGCPIPLGFDPPHPGGMTENSPTFQRWVRDLRESTSPEGTAETRRDPSAVPPGLIVLQALVPNVETLGYYRMSLRDKDLAGFAGLFGSNPSGIGQECPRAAFNECSRRACLRPSDFGIPSGFGFRFSGFSIT
jgi:hypothetical protein